MILDYRRYPPPSSVPTLVFSAATHDISTVSFFFMAWIGKFAGETGVVGMNLETMGPTVSVFYRGSVGIERIA